MREGRGRRWWALSGCVAAVAAASVVVAVPALAGRGQREQAKQPTLSSLAKQLGALRSQDIALRRRVTALSKKGSAPGLAGAIGQRGLQGVQGPSGAAGALGPAGVAGPSGAPGPSFGDTVQVQNVDHPPCGQNVVLGTEPVTVTRPSRIWAHAQGLFIDNGTPTDPYEFTMWVELRDGSGSTLANTVAGADTDIDRGNRHMPISVDGALLAGGMPGGDIAGTGTFVAAPGAYVLTLVARGAEGSTCTGGWAFGFNGQSSLGYILLGTSP